MLQNIYRNPLKVPPVTSRSETVCHLVFDRCVQYKTLLRPNCVGHTCFHQGASSKAKRHEYNLMFQLHNLAIEAVDNCLITRRSTFIRNSLIVSYICGANRLHQPLLWQWNKLSNTSVYGIALLDKLSNTSVYGI